MNFIKTLNQAIAENDVFLARGSIITYVDNDSNEGYMVALEIADKVNRIFQEKGIALFEPEDNWLKPLSREEWTPEYWNNIKAAMRMNFSREKIILATEVATHLRNQGNIEFQVSANSVKDSEANSARKRERQSPRTSPNSPRSGASSLRRTHGALHSGTPGRITVKRRSDSQLGLIVGTIVVGAVVGGAVGAAIGATAAGAVVGGAVVGGVVYCKNNKRRK